MARTASIKGGKFVLAYGQNAEVRGVAPEGVSTRDIYRGALPFVGLQVAVLAFIIAVPGLVDWLPRLAAALTPTPLT